MHSVMGHVVTMNHLGRLPRQDADHRGIGQLDRGGELDVVVADPILALLLQHLLRCGGQEGIHHQLSARRRLRQQAGKTPGQSATELVGPATDHCVGVRLHLSENPIDRLVGDEIVDDDATVTAKYLDNFARCCGGRKMGERCDCSFHWMFLSPVGRRYVCAEGAWNQAE